MRSMQHKLVFTTCSHCHKEILEGSALLSINRNIEQPNWNIVLNDFEISVIDSEELMTLCGRCAKNLNTESLRKFLVNFPLGEDVPNT